MKVEKDFNMDTPVTALGLLSWALADPFFPLHSCLTLSTEHGFGERQFFKFWYQILNGVCCWRRNKLSRDAWGTLLKEKEQKRVAWLSECLFLKKYLPRTCTKSGKFVYINMKESEFLQICSDLVFRITRNSFVREARNTSKNKSRKSEKEKSAAEDPDGHMFDGKTLREPDAGRNPMREPVESKRHQHGRAVREKKRRFGKSEVEKRPGVWESGEVCVRWWEGGMCDVFLNNSSKESSMCPWWFRTVNTILLGFKAVQNCVCFFKFSKRATFQEKIGLKMWNQNNVSSRGNILNFASRLVTSDACLWPTHCRVSHSNSTYCSSHTNVATNRPSRNDSASAMTQRCRKSGRCSDTASFTVSAAALERHVHVLSLRCNMGTVHKFVI